MYEMTTASSKNQEHVKKLLSDGWEPFAVVTNYQHTHDTIYFRREVKQAGVPAYLKS